MPDSQSDPSRELVLDGNSVAGLLQEVFGVEMTPSQAQCAACNTVNYVGELLVFGGTMGSVLRCPNCDNMMMRIVSQPEALWFSMAGISYLKQERTTIL